jgi:hypothetical protein
MKKLILPLMMVMVLAASLTGASYVATVTMDFDSEVTSTQEAELAFASAGDAVADDFVVVPDDNPLVVKFDFGKVQRKSKYQYDQVLVVTNNKPYEVILSVDSVSDGESGNLVNRLLEPGYAELAISRSDKWESSEIMYASNDRSLQSTIILTPQGTGQDYAYIGFRLITHSNAPEDTFTGEVTFKATSGS